MSKGPFDRREVDRDEPVREVDEDALKTLAATHPGFEVCCLRCGSSSVGVDSDTGYSPESGSWGSVYLRCAICGLNVAIYGADVGLVRDKYDRSTEGRIR